MAINGCEMIDIVIPLGFCSQHDNLELIYCIRSIRKYLTGWGKIYIIGAEPPDEVKNSIDVLWYPVDDQGFNKEDNIRRKIEFACNTPEISDNFFFANDDYVFLKSLDVQQLPFYYSGDLDLIYKRKRKPGHYKAAIQNTIDELEKKMYALYHFDIHVPIIYNKKLFPFVMAKYPWSKTKSGFIIKSLYCNTLMIQGVEMQDMMIGYGCTDFGQIEEMIKDRFVFAYNDSGANEVMFNFLKSKFG